MVDAGLSQHIVRGGNGKSGLSEELLNLFKSRRFVSLHHHLMRFEAHAFTFSGPGWGVGEQMIEKSARHRAAETFLGHCGLQGMIAM
ncbi:MAG: hypothetical protein K2Q23_17020, partial [Bryobacteraceae bacterium]|nr:hypothetical protein [Bryobacteraceae bacterium]